MMQTRHSGIAPIRDRAVAALYLFFLTLGEESSASRGGRRSTWRRQVSP